MDVFSVGVIAFSKKVINETSYIKVEPFSSIRMSAKVCQFGHTLLQNRWLACYCSSFSSCLLRFWHDGSKVWVQVLIKSSGQDLIRKSAINIEQASIHSSRGIPIIAAVNRLFLN